jgi:hypothetical protein
LKLTPLLLRINMKGYPDEAVAVSKAGSAYVPVLMKL